LFNTTACGQQDIVELIVVELRRQRELLCQLYQGPGKLLINLNPDNRQHPVIVQVVDVKLQAVE